MSDPYIGEIRMFAGNFAPQGWMLCQGQTLAIAQYTVLYTLIGTTYGGDGQSTFVLPDLQGRAPLHQGQGVSRGTAGGLETVRLTTSQLPVHTHRAAVGDGVTNPSTDPTGRVWSASSKPAYAKDPTTPTTPMSPSAVGPAGGAQPHPNMPPFLAINFIIAYEGLFPSTPS